MSYKTYIYGKSKHIESDSLKQAKVHKNIQDALGYVARAVQFDYAVCISPMIRKKR
jgi:hypothetical protein